jgi:hypothetical protein
LVTIIFPKLLLEHGDLNCGVGLVLVMPSLQWGAPQHFFHQVAIEFTLKILQWMCLST